MGQMQTLVDMSSGAEMTEGTAVQLSSRLANILLAAFKQKPPQAAEVS